MPIPTKFCTAIKTTKYSLWLVQQVHHKSNKMTDGRRLKKSKNRHISSTVWNLVRWRCSTLLSHPTAKNLKFKKSKTASAAIFKNKKSPSQEAFGRSWRNLARCFTLTLLTLSTVKVLLFTCFRFLASTRVLVNYSSSARVTKYLVSAALIIGLIT